MKLTPSVKRGKYVRPTKGEEFAFEVAIPELVYGYNKKNPHGGPPIPVRTVVPPHVMRRIGRGLTEEAAWADAWSLIGQWLPEGTVPTSVTPIPVDPKYRVPCQMPAEQRSAFAAQIGAWFVEKLTPLAVAREALAKAGG